MRSNFYPLVLAATITMAFALAPVAAADSQDDQFLASLAAQGITGEPAQLIAEGHTACDHFGTPQQTRDAIFLMGQGLSHHQAGTLISAGLLFFCPDKLVPPSDATPPGAPPSDAPPPG
jgi:hypothetical protein